MCFFVEFKNSSKVEMTSRHGKVRIMFDNSNHWLRADSQEFNYISLRIKFYLLSRVLELVHWLRTFIQMPFVIETRNEVKKMFYSKKSSNWNLDGNPSSYSAENEEISSSRTSFWGGKNKWANGIQEWQYNLEPSSSSGHKNNPLHYLLVKNSILFSLRTLDTYQDEHGSDDPPWPTPWFECHVQTTKWSRIKGFRHEPSIAVTEFGFEIKNIFVRFEEKVRRRGWKGDRV